MSLNKTLDRLFDEIRREAKRNPDFADRLDAVLRLHDSRRDVPDEVVEEIATPVATPPPPAGEVLSEAKRRGKGASAQAPLSQPTARADSSPPPKSQGDFGQSQNAGRGAAGGGGAVGAPAPVTTKDEGAVDAPALNPVGVYQRDGEEALVAALEDLGLPALQAMIAEHNLDPSGATADFDRDGLCAHVLAQAKRRAERDAKMFDY